MCGNRNPVDARRSTFWGMAAPSGRKRAGTLFLETRMPKPVRAMAALLAFFALAGATLLAGEATPVVIEKMDLAALERLMHSIDTPYMVVAMAAWCGPCRKELPALTRLYAKYQARGVKIVGISLDLDGPAAMQPILDKVKVNFPVFWVGEAALKAYDIYAIPMVFLIKNGQIVERIPGKRSEAFLEKKIQAFFDVP